MPPPISTIKNPYFDNPKQSNIYTPQPISAFLFNLLRGRGYTVICDPAIGSGALTDPWKASGHTVIGIDIDISAAVSADQFILGDFCNLSFADISHLPRPDLIICNPPFNRSKRDDLNDKNKADTKPKSGLPPERFLRHILTLFGPTAPIVLFGPMGMTLNQRRHSTRFAWMRDHCPQITSILSMPLDVFGGVEFHQQVLFFNIPDLPAHQFLPDAVIKALYRQDVHVDTQACVYWRTNQSGKDESGRYEVMTEEEAIARKYRPYKRKQEQVEYTEDEMKLIAKGTASGELRSMRAINALVKKLRAGNGPKRGIT